jgi:hypothetical protein
LSASVEDYTAAEVEEMEDLILSISREATDQLRRDRLRAIFIESLSQPNGDPQRFIDLFNETLIIVCHASGELNKIPQTQEAEAAERRR